MATRSLGSLTIDLIAKIAGFEQGMDKAARAADKRLKEIERRAKIAGAAIGTALVAGAGIVANQLRNTINQMDELSKAAQRANMPTEEFSKLAYAGSLADVAIQDLQSSMGRLAKAQGDAQRETSIQAQVFEALGIATKDAEGNLRSTYDVLLDFADSFKELKGSPEIMAAGMNIFGRSFQNLIPLLKDGSQGLRDAGIEAEQLGLVLSTEAGQQAEEFNDDITRLQSALTGMWREVAQQVLPNLLALTNQFVDAAKEGDTMKKVADEISGALRGIADTAKLFGDLIQVLGTVRTFLADIERFGRGFGGNKWVSEFGSKVRGALPDWMYAPIGSGSISGVSTPRPATPVQEFDPTLGAPLTPAERAAAEAARLKALRDALGGGGGNKTGGGKSEAEREAERVQRAYESLMATMRERIALFNAEGEAARLAYDLEHGALQALDSARKQELLTLAEQYDAMVKKREADQAAYELAREETRRIEESKEYAKQMLSDLEFELELLRMTNAERATAIQLRGLDAEAVALYGDRIAEANRKIEESMQRIELMDGVRNSFADLFEEVISWTSSVKDAFSNMLDSINQMILRRITENWAEKLLGSFGTDQTGSAGGGWFSALANWFGGGRAGGGMASPWHLYEVNERGFEMATVDGQDYMLTGSKPVEVTPNHRLGGGGTVVNQVFNNPVLADRRSDTQRAAEAAKRIRDAQRLMA